MNYLTEKRVFAEGLNFSSPPKYLGYADYLVNSELLYKNICKLCTLSNKDLDFVKTVRKKHLSSY